MSEVYALEPATKGKVIVNTTMGPLEIELWSKECPKACRNFVQLSLEGYYNGTIFHRLIKGFLLQGGDPTGSGAGGESIYGDASFPNEYHSRLKFRYRGLVGMANQNNDEKTGNGSQFFITLDRADGLNGKSTMFGRISGPTLWNVTRMAECEVDANDRPSEPPAIVSVEIPWNPFDDIVPRTLPKPLTQRENDSKPAALSTSVPPPAILVEKKHKSLLSFAEEEEEEDEDGAEAGPVAAMKSAHDIACDEKLSSTSAAPAPATEVKANDLKARIAAKLQNGDTAETKSINQAPSQDEMDVASGVDMTDAQATGTAQLDRSAAQKRVEEEGGCEDELEEAVKVDTAYSKDRVVEGVPVRKTGLGSDRRRALDDAAIADADLMTDAEKKRQFLKIRKSNTSRQRKEADATAALMSFEKRLKAKAGEESAWFTTGGLKFAVDSSTAYAFDAAKDALTTYDPLRDKSQADLANVSRDAIKKARRDHARGGDGPREDVAPW